VQRHCPVVEFGLVGHRMHEVDERVSCQDIQGLTLIYSDILRRYFEG
jgi:succinyl-diaminopimelate desuccinylase